MRIVYLNGNFCEEEKAFLPVCDRGFLYGDGIFETMRLYDGVPFLFEEHIQRLLKSARELKIQTDLDPAKIADIVKTLAEKNSLLNGVVRITLTRGDHAGNLDLTQTGNATVLASIRQIPSSFETNSSPPLKVITVRGYGNREKTARHKTLSYLPYIWARDEAKSEGADDAIIISEMGEVLEATTANIFLVKGAQLFTPPLESGILPGITRKAIIEICATYGIKISETAITVDDLKDAEEIFLTNSVIEILPVKSIDAMNLFISRMETTKILTEAYRKKVADYIKSHKNVFK